MGKVKHPLPHFLAVRRDFQARIHKCSPGNFELLAGASISLGRQMEKTEQKRRVGIRGGGRRLGGPQTGSGAFEKRRNMLLLPGIEL
jgi:hypothetical protein